MVRVILTATDKYNPYDKALIKRVEYKQNSLFYKYTHDPVDKLIAEDIKVFKEPKTIWQWYGYYMTLKVRNDYKKHGLKLAEVYFNTFDTKNVPIMLVLFFESGGEVENRYDSLINIDKDITKYTSKFIDELPVFHDHDSLYDNLVAENDRLNHFLTFDVSRTIFVTYYNNKKIYVYSESIIKPNSNDRSHYFAKYQHVPTNPNKGKAGCIIFNSQALLTRDEGRPVVLKEIQNIKLSTLGVYWSNIIDIPLLFELNYDFNINDHPENSYYITKKDQHGIYFKKLETSSKEFKDLSITSYGTVHDSLHEDGGTLLKTLLLKLERSLYKSLFIFFTKKDGKYSHSDVINSLTTSQFDFSRDRFTNNQGFVTAKDVTGQKEGKCLSNSPFKIIEHDFYESIKSLRHNEFVKIKFVWTNHQSALRNDIVTLDVAKTNIVNPYNAGKYYIHLSLDTFKHFHDFIRYNHTAGSDYDRLTSGEFIITHNGLSVEFIGNLEQSTNQRVEVYYHKEEKDKFILIAFILFNSKIKYLTYSDFLNFTIANKKVSLSALNEIEAKRDDRIDNNILNKLILEYNKLYLINRNNMVTLNYSRNKNKLHVILYQSLIPLLVCYNGQCYKPKSKDMYYSEWVIAEGLDSTCKKGLARDRKFEDSSDQELFSSLQAIAISLGLMGPETVVEPREKTHQRTPPIEHKKQVPSEKRLNEDPIVNVSILGPKNYDSDRISVSSVTTYQHCNLFCYYTHTSVRGTSLNISSIVVGTEPRVKVLKIHETISAHSVEVYFNVKTPVKPVLLIFNTYHGKMYYTISSISGDTYSISQYYTPLSDLTNLLIDESDKTNDTITYIIDQSSAKGYYGFSNRIILSKSENVESKGYTLLTHTPNSTANKAYVLYKGNFLVTRTNRQDEIINDIQDKKFKKILVYSLDSNKNFPIMIEFHYSSSKTYYVLKKHETSYYWTNESLKPSDSSSIKSKLLEINYFLNKSVIIEIDKRGDPKSRSEITYELKVLSNSLNTSGSDYQTTRYADAVAMDPQNKITVTVPHNIYSKSGTNRDSGFIYVKHQIPKSIYTSPHDTTSDVSGVRLFIINSTETYPLELQLSNKKEAPLDPKDRLYLYYPNSDSTSNDVFVYFFGQDPRPLVICYDYKAYVKINNDDNTKWALYNTVKYSDPSELLPILQSIHSKIKRKLRFINLGEEQNISISNEYSIGDFKRIVYTASGYSKDPNGPFNLPISTLTKSLTDKAIITKLLQNLHNKTFDSVTIYFKSVTTDIFLIEFTNESSRTHYQKVDKAGKFWVNKYVKYEDEKELSTNLTLIKESIQTRLVYEIDKTDGRYNSGIDVKVSIVDPQRGFTRYAHFPVDLIPKLSLILYNGVELMERDNEVLEPITELQDQQYHSVRVYFGSTYKDPTIPGQKVPLAVEFHVLEGRQDSTTQYIIRRDSTRYYWEYTITPNKDSTKHLISKLKDIELDLMDSIVVLVEKNQTFKYGEPEILKALKSLSPPKDINLYKMDRDCVRIYDRTQDNLGRCIYGTGYKVFEHNINACIKDNVTCGLRLFIPSPSGSERYSDITLYNSFNYTDTLYYSKPGGNDKVYVYYYGGLSDPSIRGFDNSDPRPLLVYYGNNAYIPKKLSGLFTYKQVNVDYTTWVSVSDIRECIYKFNVKPGQASFNEPLLNTLVEVSGYLNPVQLNPKKITTLSSFVPDSFYRSTTASYTIHTYPTDHDIMIEIKSDNLNCYRKYTYTPREYSNAHYDYRLGNLIYTDYKGNSHVIDYTDSNYKYYSLVEVSVFYNVFDYDHNYPLFIILGFKDAELHTYADCYQLTGIPDQNGIGTFNWVKIKEDGDDKDFLNTLRHLNYEISGIEKFINKKGHDRIFDIMNDSINQLDQLSSQLYDHIEYKLYYIRSKLKIEFSEEQKRRPLFDPKNCYEDSNTSTIIKATSGTLGTVATVGTTVGVTALVRPELFIPVINALT